MTDRSSRDLDEAGKSISSFSPPKKDDLIPALVASALSGAAFTLATSAVSSFSSKTVRVEDRPLTSAQESFDRTNVHHAVEDNGLASRAVICKPVERVGDPAQISEPLVSLAQRPQDASGIEEYLAKRGMQLADAKQCSMFLCSHKMSISELENQKAALEAAEKAVETAKIAWEEAQKNTAEAYDRAIRDLDLTIGIPSGVSVTINGGILNDYPSYAKAKIIEKELAFEYNKTVTVFGIQRARLSKLERKINGDSDDSWSQVIWGLIKGIFGVAVSRDF